MPTPPGAGIESDRIMSIYNINRICYNVEHDKTFREKMLRDPAAAVADFDLTEEEKTALLNAEVGKLHDMGAHDYLLGHLRRYGVFGLNRENYKPKMLLAKNK